MKTLEVLSPCGNRESLISAINGGADAVYLGLSDFNARKKADNFTLESLESAVKYAHLHGVKVYLTVNTLVADSEVENFLTLVSGALKSGVDAFIVQDFGMATLLKETFKGITLHASTQMGVHNLQGALFLERFGFKRVVLSRETKLEDIIAIKQNTSLEIEFFVHGALCVGFSGNCYMSAVKTGKSGNRGECKQLCRLNYSSQGKNGKLLSPNDLCLIMNLKTLIDAGVTSFKIEGRLKRPSYVYATAKSYKKALLGASETTLINERKNLSKIFSRGEFNETAYLYDNDDIIDSKNQSHTGEFLGEVIAVAPFKNLYAVTIASNAPLNTGDGLKFIGRTETSLGVGNITVKDGNYTVYTTNTQVKIKDKVYRLVDSAYENEMLKDSKKIPLSVRFNADEKTATLTLLANNKSVSVSATTQPAKTAPIDKTFIKNQMKFGDTLFEMVNFDATADNVFMPKSQINDLRRQAVSALEDSILESNKSDFLKANPNFDGNFIAPKKQALSLPTAKYTVVNEYTKTHAKGEVIFFPTNYSKDTLQTLTQKYLNEYSNGNTYLHLPPIATGKDIKIIDALLEDFPKLNIYANNYYGLTYNGRKIVAGFGLNAYNAYTVKALKDLGVYEVLPSFETHPFAINGDITVMTLTHCPYKASLNSTCSNCTADTPLTYIGDDKIPHSVRRYKIAYCYFELKSPNKNYSTTPILSDERSYTNNY